MSSFAKIIKLPKFTDKGSLTVLEKVLPFDLKRIYWIYDSDGYERGGHRHIKTRQAFVAMSGEVEIYMSNGKEEKTITLNKPNELLIVEPEDWHSLNFSNGGVLVVFASDYYDTNDYIEERC